MRIREADTPFKLPGSDSPLKRSTSVTSVLQGVGSLPNNNYYVDSLQRFRRDYASVDKSQRQQKKMHDDQIRNHKRKIVIEREQSLKRIQEQNFEKLRNRQSRSMYLHNLGAKKTIHSHGIPIDPVNMYYQNTEIGRRQQLKDSEKRVNTLVRSHHLQTCGNSGYNIINGQASIGTVEKMLSPQQFPAFQQKLNVFYEKFRIKL